MIYLKAQGDEYIFIYELSEDYLHVKPVFTNNKNYIENKKMWKWHHNRITLEALEEGSWDGKNWKFDILTKRQAFMESL